MPKKASRTSTKAARKSPAQTRAAPRPTARKAVATTSKAAPASKLIDRRIKELGDWRGKTLQRVREIITKADPAILEEWKWETPAWSRDGLICTGETYKSAVKLTFAKGASLKDPSRLFTSSLEGRVRRAVDIREGDNINEAALRDLVRQAVALNRGGKAPAKDKKPVLLSGGNPQIAKGYGDAPVQAYIAAMPGWKRDVGRRIDEIIVRAVPKVQKAVKWNSPFYGMDGEGWFLNFHTYTNYIKVAFFRGLSLRPVPPGESKSQDTRYLDIRKDDEIDEAQLASWVKQASKLPGEKL